MSYISLWNKKERATELMERKFSYRIYDLKSDRDTKKYDPIGTRMFLGRGTISLIHRERNDLRA